MGITSFYSCKKNLQRIKYLGPCSKTATEPGIAICCFQCLTITPCSVHSVDRGFLSNRRMDAAVPLLSDWYATHYITFRPAHHNSHLVAHPHVLKTRSGKGHGDCVGCLYLHLGDTARPWGDLQICWVLLELCSYRGIAKLLLRVLGSEVRHGWTLENLAAVYTNNLEEACVTPYLLWV